MRQLFVIILACLWQTNVNGQSSCEDVDPVSCAAMAKDSDICTDPILATHICQKHCNRCPLLCYSGLTTVDRNMNIVDDHQLNPITCNTGEVCVLSQAPSGSSQYNAACGDKQKCYQDSLCCSQDLCNTPSNLLQPPTTTTLATTATTRTTTLAPIAGQGQPPTNVAFSTGLTHDITSLRAGAVVYDKVFVNVGNGYDSTSGAFTAPIAGMYAFQFYTLAHKDKSSWLELYHNTAYIASIYGHTANDYASGGNSVVLKLAQRDTVSIKASDNQDGVDTNIYGQPNEIYSTFSGYLLSPVSEELPGAHV